MVGNSSHLASVLGARARIFLKLFPELRANSPSELVDLLSSEFRLHNDPPSKIRWSLSGEGRGLEGSLPCEVIV